MVVVAVLRTNVMHVRNPGSRGTHNVEWSDAGISKVE